MGLQLFSTSAAQLGHFPSSSPCNPMAAAGGLFAQFDLFIAQVVRVFDVHQTQTYLDRRQLPTTSQGFCLALCLIASNHAEQLVVT